MKSIIFSTLVLLSLVAAAQAPCSFKSDSIIVDTPNKKEFLDVMEVTIKNNYRFQFIKRGTKPFLKIIVRDDLGFGQAGPLMLLSSKKQIGIKDMTLIPIDKKTAYFVFELNPNYIATLKEYGLSSLVFRDLVEFIVPKTDSEKIKQVAGCFFDAVVPK